ncbi:thermonuclease family protein [Haloferula sp. BvORR071]|uniref:thermonuclease family protein n=1 Tax=Haloferula sp. BvORR071 TaxID=1396141 RepID=UPI000552BEC8|nr:thermonuclease family protein [Haloferula sp. BvORR071]
MARRAPVKSWQQLLLMVVLAVVAALARHYNKTDSSARTDRPDRKPAKEAPASKPGGSGPATSASTSRDKTDTYVTFQNCRYEEHVQNDGDSFRVRLPDGSVEQFRLYFVDCPESQFRSYRGGETNRERIHEQAEYFGITDEQAVEIGSRAKARIHELLGKGPFTLYTRWDDPFGDLRFHAFVLPAGGPYLEETLVREGLARIYTKGAEMPDGLSFKARQEQLRKLEAEARKAKRGAWGMR